MTDLVTAIRAAIEETERIAQAAGGTAWVRTTTYPDQAGVEDAATGEVVVYDEGFPTVAQAEHIVRHDPAAVLRRCAADRKILDLCELLNEPGLYEAVGALAEAYGIDTRSPQLVALSEHLDTHGCATEGHPNWMRGFGNCPDAMALFNRLPDHERVLIG